MIRRSALGVLISATFPGLPLLRGSSDVVRARSAEASIACQNIASAVAIVERVILAVPIHTTSTCLDLCAPRSLSAPRVCWTEAYRCKSSNHQNRAYHHFSTSMQGLVITPRRLSLFQYVVAFKLASLETPINCSCSCRSFRIFDFDPGFRRAANRPETHASTMALGGLSHHAPVSVERRSKCGRSGTDGCESGRQSDGADTIADHGDPPVEDGAARGRLAGNESRRRIHGPTARVTHTPQQAPDT